VICSVVFLVIAWRPAPSIACSAYLYILAQTIFILLSPSNMSCFYNFTCFQITAWWTAPSSTWQPAPSSP
jgi:hypothetical protein